MDCLQKKTSLVLACLNQVSGQTLLSEVGEQIMVKHISGHLVVMKERQKLVQLMTQNGLWVPQVAKERLALSNSLVRSQALKHQTS